MLAKSGYNVAWNPRSKAVLKIMRTLKTMLLLLALALFGAAALSAEDSLGDAARKARMSKPAPAARVRAFDNDSLPKEGGLIVMGAATPPASSGKPGEA